MREIAGCILAGGKNLRMGGEKKVYLKYQGETFLIGSGGISRIFPGSICLWKTEADIRKRG